MKDFKYFGNYVKEDVNEIESLLSTFNWNAYDIEDSTKRVEAFKENREIYKRLEYLKVNGFKKI
jgi:hypothetical protein